MLAVSQDPQIQLFAILKYDASETRVTMMERQRERQLPDSPGSPTALSRPMYHTN